MWITEVTERERETVECYRVRVGEREIYKVRENEMWTDRENVSNKGNCKKKDEERVKAGEIDV